MATSIIKAHLAYKELKASTLVPSTSTKFAFGEAAKNYDFIVIGVSYTAGSYISNFRIIPTFMWKDNGTVNSRLYLNNYQNGNDYASIDKYASDGVYLSSPNPTNVAAVVYGIKIGA